MHLLIRVLVSAFLPPTHPSNHTSLPIPQCEYVIGGVHHGAEKVLLKCSWSADQEFVAAGSADR